MAWLALAALQVGNLRIEPGALLLGRWGQLEPSVADFALLRRLVEDGLRCFCGTIDSWVGLFIPASAPASPIQAISRAVLAALEDAEVQQQLQVQAGVALAPPMPAPQLAAFYPAEIERYTQAIRKAKLQLD